MKAEIGQWVRINYTDTGASDGIVVGKRRRIRTKGRAWYQYDVYLVGDKTVDTSVEEDQIIAVGNNVIAENSGM